MPSRPASTAPTPVCTPSRVDPPRVRRGRGFTVLELLIGLAIVGVLSSIAYPAFSATLASTRRADALIGLMKIQLQQERFRGEHPAYGDLAALGLLPRSPDGHYELSVLEPSDSGYAARASATGAQQADRACRHLQLTVDGLNIAYQSGADESMDNPPAANRRCWSQ